MISFSVVCHVNEDFETKLAYFDKYLSLERLNKTKYVLGIYNCPFCNNVFHWKGPIGLNMSSNIYNILHRYLIFITFDIQRKML